MTDALVAVTIAAMGVAVAAASLQLALRASQQAAQARRAEAILTHLLATAPRRVGTLNGTSEGLVWSVNIEDRGLKDARLCRLDAQVAVPKSHTLYRRIAERWCAPDPVAGK